MAYMIEAYTNLTEDEREHHDGRRDLQAAKERTEDLELAIEDVLAWFDRQPDALRWSEPAETLREARYGDDAAA